jgi:hypothetical protein
MDRRLFAIAAALSVTACAGQRPVAPATPAPARPAQATAQAPAAAPATLRYAAGASRYRLEQSTHVTQEVMGQVNEADLTARQVLSTTTADAAGSLALTVTVDSIEVTGPAGADAGLSAARGQTFRLVLSPSGLVVSLVAPDSTNPLMQQFGAGLREFFPRLPATPIASGQTWADTVTSSRSGDASVTTRSVRQHRVVGWEDRDGVRALHVETTSAYTVSGSTEAQGQTVELSGGGQSVRDAFVSAAGIFLGSVERDSALVNANVTAMGLNVPIRQSRRATVTRLQ